MSKRFVKALLVAILLAFALSVNVAPLNPTPVVLAEGCSSPGDGCPVG